MNEAETLTLRDEYGCDQIEYLGDGVYAGYDGYHIWVCCRRDDQMHAVAFEPAVFRKLAKYGDTPA